MWSSSPRDLEAKDFLDPQPDVCEKACFTDRLRDLLDGRLLHDFTLTVPAVETFAALRVEFTLFALFEKAIAADCRRCELNATATLACKSLAAIICLFAFLALLDDSIAADRFGQIPFAIAVGFADAVNFPAELLACADAAGRVAFFVLVDDAVAAHVLWDLLRGCLWGTYDFASLECEDDARKRASSSPDCDARADLLCGDGEFDIAWRIVLVVCDEDAVLCEALVETAAHVLEFEIALG